MDTPYGLRGSIIPQAPFQGHHETLHSGPFIISLDDGVLEVGFDDETLTAAARESVRDYLRAASLERGQRFTVDLNQSWRKTLDGSKQIGIQLSETLTPHIGETLRITTVTKAGKVSNVLTYDSRNLADHTALVEKCQRDPALLSALRYFGDEIIQDDLPLYGIYKAIEALTSKWGKDGRRELAALLNENKKYVDDVMQTAQTIRHHADPNARAVLTENECRARAKKLILAYANAVI
jgi:hypothetical protein